MPGEGPTARDARARPGVRQGPLEHLAGARVRGPGPATDRWIPATDGLRRIERWACPTHADARNLPYAEASSQAVVCADAYTYTGTHDLYLEYLHKFVRPTGQIGIVVPVFMQELRGPLPEHLKPFWAQACWTWHTVEWWRQLWSRTGRVRVLRADHLPDGWRLWHQWKKARQAAGDDSPGLASDIQVHEANGTQDMGFHRMIAEVVPS